METLSLLFVPPAEGDGMEINMKYFELKGNDMYKFTPRLINWYGEFDVRNIRIDKFYKLPKCHLFKIESSESTIFSDAIFFPFLLVSPMIKNVIKMYGDSSYFVDIILLDPKHGKSELYHLPVFEETDDLQIGYKTYDKGVRKTKPEKGADCIVTMERNIFWVHDNQKRHTIISQDLAESLLRREAIGIDLQEIVLYKKD